MTSRFSYSQPEAGPCSDGSPTRPVRPTNRSPGSSTRSSVHIASKQRRTRELDSALGVVLELPHLLRTPARDGELRGPRDGRLPRRQFEDGITAVGYLGLRIELVGDGSLT